MPRGSRTHTCANTTLQFLHALLIGIAVKKILICDIESGCKVCLIQLFFETF